MTYRDRDRVYAWLDAGHGENLTTLDRAVLVMIAERANKATGISAPGIDEPARRWGVIPKSIDRSVSRLHRFGLVDTVTRGRGQSRARYVLTGEVAPPAGGASRSPETSSSTPETSSSTPGGGTVLSKSSRSSSEVMTEQDAPPRAALTGALRRGPEQTPLPAELIAHITHTLGMTTEQAKAWAETKLNGRAVRNIEKYIRTCVENYSPRKPKAKPDRITPQQALDRIAQLAGLNGVRLIEAEPDVLGEVVVDRGGVELIAYAMEGEDTMTMYCLDDARSWPEDERRDYLPQPDDKANQIKPAEAVALAERFLAHAERLGYTEQDQ